MNFVDLLLPNYYVDILQKDKLVLLVSVVGNKKKTGIQMKK